MGNQLFQYAAGFAIARRIGANLFLDPAQCYAETERPYQLCHLNISGRPWTTAEASYFEPWVRATRPADAATKFWLRPVKALVRSALRHRFSYVEDRFSGYDRSVARIRHSVYLTGTWASEKYFAERRADILREFSFPHAPDPENAALLGEISRCEAVAVHVRRGDYVTTPENILKHGLCSVDYYARASGRILTNVPDANFFVFSDDPTWAGENIRLPGAVTFVTHNVGKRNHEDLRLMAACKHFIIANSTFSWWGAWLATNPGKRVIAPARWMADPGRTDHPAPENWERL